MLLSKKAVEKTLNLYILDRPSYYRRLFVKERYRLLRRVSLTRFLRAVTVDLNELVLSDCSMHGVLDSGIPPMRSFMIFLETN